MCLATKEKEEICEFDGNSLFVSDEIVANPCADMPKIQSRLEDYFCGMMISSSLMESGLLIIFKEGEEPSDSEVAEVMMNFKQHLGGLIIF